VTWRCLVLLLSLRIVSAQDTASQSAASGNEGGLSDRFWLSGQVNVVNQSHPGFDAKYSGPNSIRPDAAEATTWVATLYTGIRLLKNTEFFCDVESARGAGVSGALGLGGLSDLDAVTEPNASVAPYVARIQFRQIIPLGDATEEVTRSPLNLAPSLPSNRLEIRAGKMSVTDFFDLNSVGSDSHLQFLNYSIDNNAAFDFAADARGYTYGVLFEYYHPGWAARFAETLEPSDTSGLTTNWNVSKSRSENFEVEYDHSFLRRRSGTFRFSGFVNHAQMASYPEAVAAYLSGLDPKPNLLAHLKQGQTNYGLGVNGEHEVTDSLRVVGRFGWNPGKQEAFQFAEADHTLALGADLGGNRWHRKQDRVGVAVAINGLARAHRTYLALGGISYLLGDGGLNYGKEKIVEAYYNFRALHGMYIAFDVQYFQNPGYNRDRGPVWIFGIRLHLEGDVHFN
jgi:high affinity Mn2+ porin